MTCQGMQAFTHTSLDERGLIKCPHCPLCGLKADVVVAVNVAPLPRTFPRRLSQPGRSRSVQRAERPSGVKLSMRGMRTRLTRKRAESLVPAAGLRRVERSPRLPHRAIGSAAVPRR